MLLYTAPIMTSLNQSQRPAPDFCNHSSPSSSTRILQPRTKCSTLTGQIPCIRSIANAIVQQQHSMDVEMRAVARVQPRAVRGVAEAIATPASQGNRRDRTHLRKWRLHPCTLCDREQNYGVVIMHAYGESMHVCDVLRQIFGAGLSPYWI